MIISKLLGVGWHRQDIDEGFLSVESESRPKVSSPEIVKEVESPKIEVINKIEPKQENLQRHVQVILSYFFTTILYFL